MMAAQVLVCGCTAYGFDDVGEKPLYVHNFIHIHWTRLRDQNLQPSSQQGAWNSGNTW